jgi:4'-phosphopantetheinyl transferase
MATEIEHRPEWNLLSADERERSQRYRQPRDRHRFLTVRSTLRRLLGRYLDIAPENLEFAYSDRGKPNLRDTNLTFNVSHSHDVALIAITRDRTLGVDVEYHRLRDVESLARRFFSPRELATLQALPKSDRPTRFFQLWTAKEAYLKATGEGLSGLSEIEIEWHEATNFDNSQSKPKLYQKPHWQLHSLFPHANYSAALVVESGGIDAVEYRGYSAVNLDRLLL